MLRTAQAFSSFSVNDLERAKQFYEEILGLEVTDKEYMLELQAPGAGSVLVYPKDNHEPATFTVLNFRVADIQDIVQRLKGKGISCERYDMPQMTVDDNHIYHDADMQMKIAWFKDPAGNIFSLIEEQR